MAKLTDKQEMFCLEYLKDLNATQASIRAGYSENTAGVIGAENLAKPYIQTRIAELMEERRNEVKADANYVLNRLLEIDCLDIADIVDEKGDLKPIKQWSKAWRTSVNAIDVSVLHDTGDVTAFLKKVKTPDKLRNLELIGKHTVVQAFKEKIDANVEVNSFEEIMKRATSNE